MKNPDCAKNITHKNTMMQNLDERTKKPKESKLKIKKKKKKKKKKKICGLVSLVVGKGKWCGPHSVGGCNTPKFIP
jgi:transcription antitermination factor NusG